MLDLIEIFKALSNPKRLEILQLLNNPQLHFVDDPCEIVNSGVCLRSIERKVGLSQSTISHYINILHKANLIHFERIGTWTYCRLNREILSSLAKEINLIFKLQ